MPNLTSFLTSTTQRRRRVQAGDLVARKKEYLANFSYTGLCEVLFVDHGTIRVAYNTLCEGRSAKFFAVIGRRV